MNSPLVSIIVPIFNTEQFLRQCIISLTRQTYENIEIILIDDGSTDGCADICAELVRSDRSRLGESGRW